MAAAAGLLLLSCLSVFINPGKAWLLVPLELIFWPLVIINLLLVIWSVARRSKAVIIPLVALIPALFFLGRFIQTSGASELEEGKRELKVVSYNVGAFRADSKKYSPAACRDSITAFLRRTDADIICLQEYRMPNNGGDIATILAGIVRGYRPTFYFLTGKSGKSGNVLLSRYRPVGKGKIKFDNSTNLAIWADYKLADRTVRVYNCHLESYGISPAGVVTGIFGDKRKDVLERTGRKMSRAIGLRANQVEQIFTEIDNSPHETLICGDFNDTPLSYTYFKTRRGHRDAFMEAGKGFGSTYPSAIPTIRIDYVFCPKSMEVLSYDTPGLKFSDHRPVVTRLQY